MLIGPGWMSQDNKSDTIMEAENVTVEVIEQERLIWYGHIRIMEECRIANVATIIGLIGANQIHIDFRLK